MTIRNLDHMFRPRSVAVVGASNAPDSIGGTVMRNLREAGFAGPVMPVNPKHRAVDGVLAYDDVSALPLTPDLAVICTPPPTVPGLIAALGERGTKAAIVLTAGLDRVKDERGRTLQRAMLDAARPHSLRVLGPNCVGLMNARLRLNASFAHTSPAPGKLAFVTQSGAMVTAVLDHAKSSEIGFSFFVSLGNSADVDFGDVLDYLGGDPDTRAILLYIESIGDAREFMSAARAAARNKPVLAIKAGRVAESAQAVASHTGVMAGSDDVFDAAIRRAGMLRVDTIADLFDSVETLARMRPLRGDRLTILTNGGGPGVMAADALVLSGGRLATLTEKTMGRLNAALPANWSKGNPVDIVGDASADRYAETLKILLDDEATDALLFLHAPLAIADSHEIARKSAAVIQGYKRNVLACWLGSDAVRRARQTFTDAGIPTYDSPEHAVRAFLQMVGYRRNQELLMETPQAAPRDFSPDLGEARRVIEAVLGDERDMLSEPEAKDVLEAYGIPVAAARVARSVDEAATVAERIGFPVAVKILSPDITHKSDVGGVALDLGGDEDVRRAARNMKERLEKLRANARFDGFSVQRMARRPDAQELIVGATTDPIFGPVVLFGHGGTAVEVIRDRAVALPPLNTVLAKELVSRTRVAKLLGGYRDRPPADMNAIYRTLMQVAQLVADIPEIMEIDINPLLADDRGVIAVDARIRIEPATVSGAERLAIRPYPQDLEERIDLGGRPVLLRPIRPEDEPQHLDLFNHLTPEDVRFRFFSMLRQLAHSQLARYTQIDYDREMAFIASARDDQGQPETLGVVRAICDPDNVTAEFAIVIRSDQKGQGLGRILLEKIIAYCRRRGTRRMVGEVLRENRGMRRLAEKVGFQTEAGIDGDTVKLRLDLVDSTRELAASGQR